MRKPYWNLKHKFESIDNIDIIHDDFLIYVFSRQGENLKQRFARIFTSEQFKRLACETGFDASCSPVDLNCGQWSILFNCYVQSVSKVKQNEVGGAYSKHSYRRLVYSYGRIERLYNTQRINWHAVIAGIPSGSWQKDQKYYYKFEGGGFEAENRHFQT